MTYDVLAIDTVCNYEMDDADTDRPEWSKTFIGDKIGGDAKSLGGYTADAFLEKMDRAGVEHTFLIAVKAGSSSQRIHRHISYDVVANMCRRHPKRFSGLAGIDPTEGMAQVRQLQHAVEELGFVGAHLYPHWYDMAPDANRYYPIYSKCCELDVPIQMQVGHCLRYSELRPLQSVGRPITLDTIACHFPELKLVGIHIGWPWVEEMISVAYKHPNVYIGSDAYAPAYWDEKFVHFINSWGSKKVIFGTDYPVIDPERARTEIEALNLRPESKRRFLRDNTIDLYKLDLPKSQVSEAAA